MQRADTWRDGTRGQGHAGHPPPPARSAPLEEIRDVRSIRSLAGGDRAISRRARRRIWILTSKPTSGGGCYTPTSACFVLGILRQIDGGRTVRLRNHPLRPVAPTSSVSAGRSRQMIALAAEDKGSHLHDDLALGALRRMGFQGRPGFILGCQGPHSNERARSISTPRRAHSFASRDDRMWSSSACSMTAAGRMSVSQQRSPYCSI